MRCTAALPFLFLLLVSGVLVTGCGESADTAEDQNDTTDASETLPFNAVGDSIVFAVDMLTLQSLEQGGETIDQELENIGTMTFVKGDDAGEGTRWKSISNISMIGKMKGQEMGRQEKKQEMIYTVSTDGKVVDLKISGMDDQVGAEMQRVLERSAGGQTGMQMFMEKEWLNKNVGDTWSDHLRDTIQIDGTETKVESANIIMEIKTDYTFEGHVDTLGHKTVRIRYVINQVSMDGTVTAPNGGETTIKSDGQGSGVFYYDVDDLLQVATQSITDVEMELGMPKTGKTIDITQHMVAMMARKNGPTLE